ncbi:protein PFC0760c isoform X1 [Polyergus mexicanus]|uniref:protein PFC0760c isoform X1 n=1 Tax=Polyergus mexicanus TaxID=615972 RepID=UPI0038B614C1
MIARRFSDCRHDACINRLRMRYIQYLEEQRTRDERNHKLLAALDKVTNKLALISAKKDRLNVLRKQYEAYLLRVYANRRQPGSVTGDSGIASQNEDKYTKKIVTLAQPDIASAETRSVSSPRVHLSTQSNQPRSTSTSKLHDQIAVNGILLNNSPILPTTPLSAPLGADYHQTRVPREPHVYVSPSEQLTQVSAISSPNTRQYPRTISDYDESVSRDLQNVGNFRALHTKAPVLPMSSLDQIQPDTVPVNRFFREHVESLQAATSGLSTQFPAGKARYEETSRNEPVSRRFDPLTALKCDDVNIMLSSSQSQIREYDRSDVAGATLMTAKSNTYRVDPNISVVDQIDPLPGYMDYIEASPQKFEDEGSIHSLTSDDVDDMIRHNEHLLWSTDGAKTPCRSSIDVLGLHNANLDENGRTTAILENELDQYISKIRKIHREHGVTSLEELDHEQNTSGDLLNVTLSEDAAELPVENRARKERVSEKMDRMLTLASDLASKTTGLKEIVRNTTGQSGNDNLSAEIVRDEIRLREATTDDTSQFEGKREAEGRGISAKNEIREDVATHSTELEQTRRNTEIAKESWNNAAKKDDTHKKTAASSSNGTHIDDRNNASEKKQFDLVIGEESNIDGLFDVAEELTPWNLASVQKEVRELDLSDPDEARVVKKDVEETENKIVDEIASESHVLLPFIEKSGANDEVENTHHLQDTLPREEMESKKLDACKASESHETHHPSVENAEDVTFQISNQHKADESKIASHTNEELGESKENNDKKQDNDETREPQIDDRSENVIKDNEYSVEQEYVEDSSQERQYEQNSNEQYHYDQGVSYERVNNEEYERYAAQGYAQEGQEYVEYVDGQYEQYPEDLNNPQYQHDPDAQYEQDPNQAYDYNYDPNQGYGNDPNQQYDPNQGYENSSSNQAYDYTEQVSYDPNQVYDNIYEQEEQHNSDNNVVVENPEKEPETEETSQRQANPELEHKSSRDEDPQSKDEEPQQVDTVSGTKKKKDVIKSLLDSDTDTTIERNVSNTESDFDFN